VTVRDNDWLAQRFEEQRARLRAVAFRILGSYSEADDAVQEAWIRFSRSDTSAVVDLRSWLTTVVSRLCLDILQARRSRSEVPLELDALDAPTGMGSVADPEEEAILADSIGAALLVVLEALAPAERVAFVLHDMFAVSFDEIAQIIGRNPAAARQLASRGRRRVQGRGIDSDSDGIRHAKLIDAFLAAARRGDFARLLAILDPDVVLKADEEALQLGAQETRGAKGVASWFSGRAGGATPALVNGDAGAVWMPGRRPLVVLVFTTAGGRIVEIDLIANARRIREMNLVIPT
jgi:RNA polymerase sigma-70 factor, ECF subfamily